MAYRPGAQPMDAVAPDESMKRPGGAEVQALEWPASAAYLPASQILHVVELVARE